MGSAGTIASELLGPPLPFDPSAGSLASALIVYILNVGDGDAIVVQFPESDGKREYAVVDAFDGDKTVGLLRSLGAERLRFVCATHPHLDHIRGIPAVLDHFAATGGLNGQFWDSGFRFTSLTYRRIIERVAGEPLMGFVRPTAGYETHIAGAGVTVLSPSIHLRNRYDTHGIDVNNASVIMRLDYPARSFVDDTLARAGDVPAAEPATRSVILGGDAQTDAWSKVLDEFPHFNRDPKNFGQQISARTRRQPLACDVFKVSHHASKHGVNLELIERMGDTSGSGLSKGPRFLVSSCADGPRSGHGFPHGVVQEILREVRAPTASSGATRPADAALGIHYTSQMIDNGAPAGSVAVVLHESGALPHLYRFGDDEGEPVNLEGARRVL